MSVDINYTDGHKVINFSGATPTFGDLKNSNFGVFNNYSSNSFSSVFPDDQLALALSSFTIYSEEGVPKITVFADTNGYIRAFNRDIQPLSGPSSQQWSQMVGNAAFMTSWSGGFIDLHEADFCPTVATIIEEPNQDVSNKQTFLVSGDDWTSKLWLHHFDLDAHQLDSNGNEIIDCANSIDPEYGNVINKQGMFITSNLQEHITSAITINSDEPTDESINASSDKEAALALREALIYPGLNITTTYSSCYKFFVIPVKTDVIALNNSPVNLGVVLFDYELNAFQYRHIASDLSAVSTYIKISNGYNGSYKKVLRYSDLEPNDTAISTFTGFSFDTNGLKATAGKKWNSSSNQFSTGETLSGNNWDILYSQLPVAFGNRLLAASDTTILSEAALGTSDALSDYDTSAVELEEKSDNVGYFNIAYGTKHGFVLMRMHSHCPIILDPSTPDGIELHIPGGKWDYTETINGVDSTPINDAGGYTPISMVFSPDNNFLYTVVAKPDERDKRYICIYDLTNPDVDAINSSAQIYADPFEAGVKNVRLLANNKIVFFSRSGNEYSVSTPDIDTQAGVLGFDIGGYTSSASEVDFSITPMKGLWSTASSNNTWKGANTPPIASGSVMLVNTATTDSSVATPYGYLDVQNPANGFTPTASLNAANAENWINSVLISDGNNSPFIAAKLERIDNVTTVTIFNPNTNDIEHILTLDDSYIHDEFYTMPDSISYVKLASPANMYGILVHYANHNPLLVSGEAGAAFFGGMQGTNTPDSFVGYNKSFVCLVELSADNTVNIITDMSSDNPNLAPYSPPLATWNIVGSQDSTGSSRQMQTFGGMKIISLDGDDSYLIELKNNDDDVYHDISFNSAKDMSHDYIRVEINISNLSSGHSASTLSYDSVNNTVSAFTGATAASFKYIGLPSTFGKKPSITPNPPTHSFIAVSHDANFIAGFYYNTTAATVLIFAPHATMEFEQDDRHLASKLSEAASRKLSGYIGEDFYISGAEFAANRRNLYVLLKHKADETISKIIKIDIGNTDNYYNGYNTEGPFTTYNIPESNLLEVSEYHYTTAISVSEAYAGFELPPGVTSETLLDTSIQNNTYITGMFKALDHRIYFICENEGSTALTLGRIVNPDTIIGAPTSATRYIKAGIPLTINDLS
jgi:hypothetical protein